MKHPAIIALLLSLTCTFLMPEKAFCQDDTSSVFIDLSKLKRIKIFTDDFSYAYSGRHDKLQEKFSSLEFIPGPFKDNPIPVRLTTNRIILKFRVSNSSDSSIAAWFFPGYFFPEIRLYNYENGQLTELPSIFPEDKKESSFKEFIVPPNGSMIVIAEILPLKTYTNSLNPRLIQSTYLNSYIAILSGVNRTENIFTYIFSGLLLMMIFFSLANYLQNLNSEFLLYAGYAFFIGFMLFLKTASIPGADHFNFFMEGYLDFVMQGIGIIFYMAFMKKFLDTRTRHRFLYHLYNWGIVIVIISLALYSYSYFFTDDYRLQNETENAAKLILLLMVVIFIFYSFRRRKEHLLWYMFWGNLCLFVFSLMSQFTILFNYMVWDIQGLFTSGIFYYETGIWLELIFFLLGLSYKNKQQLITETKEKEQLIATNKLMEYEKELAVLKAQQEERERISADMHDELGSGMTVIRLMSEIAKDKLKDQAPSEIGKISDSANEVLDKMNTIIWSMSSSNDTLDNLIYYIRNYATEYFENTPIRCEVNVPENIPQHVMSGNKRRNIFLSAKEALNNVLKHSGASSVSIDIAVNPNLRIRIVDNGKGIDMDHIRRFGNGLKNMSKRMEDIGGSFQIENNNGTLVTLQSPL
ncbi:MAG: histidine kinase [Chitinophagales bacterium]|nr:histidine kinase [Chitinophagales bacterium]